MAIVCDFLSMAGVVANALRLLGSLGEEADEERCSTMNRKNERGIAGFCAAEAEEVRRVQAQKAENMV